MRIPVYKPTFAGREREYLLQAFDSGWISSRGEFVERFERAFADAIGVGDASSVANGTVALHLAMLGAGLGPGDEVIVPTFTYVASVNAIAYVGATPVFVDCDPVTWQLDPLDVRRSVGPRTRAIMAVHLYGHPADMTTLSTVAREHDLVLIEDAAEAFGALWGDRHVGSFGDIATFSFFGNKTITTGEGGMVIAKSPNVAQEMRRLKSQYVSSSRPYWHDKIGHNFRMTNLQAAIGLAQLERAAEILERKRRLAEIYREAFAGSPVEIHAESPGALHAFWMVSALLPDAALRDPLIAHLAALGIEARPLFYPVHTMPMYASLPSARRPHPVSQSIAARGLNLPSWPDLTDDVARSIADAVLIFLARDARGPTERGEAR